MFCGNCGNQIEDDAKFCPFCGSQVVDSVENSAATTEHVTNDATSNVQGEQVVNQTMDTYAQAEPQVQAQPEVANQQEQVQAQVEPQQSYVQPQQETQAQQAYVQPQQEAQAQQSYVQPQQEQPQYQQANQQAQQTSQSNPANKKKKGKKLIIIGGIVVVLAVGGGVGGYFIYQNHLSKQADKVITLFDEGNYEESTKIYEKYCANKDSLREEIETKLIERMDEAVNNYKSETMSYDEIISLFDEIQGYNDEFIYDKLSDNMDLVDSIYDSRIYYNDAEDYFSYGDYDSAITYYQFVEEIDDVYYAKAQEGIKKAQEAKKEQEEQAEQERLAQLKQTALSDAQFYADSSDFDTAILTIETALDSLPGDAELLAKIDDYKAMIEKTNKVDISTITFEPFKDEVKEGDIVLSTLELSIPKLPDDIPVYRLINEDMAGMKEAYISYEQDEANLAREWCTEELFVPASTSWMGEVGYNDHGIFALKFTGYVFTGGAHGTPYYNNIMYNLKESRQIQLYDILSINEYEFNQLVVTAFTDLINATPDAFNADAIQCVEDMTTFNDQIYLGEDGIHVYFEPYAIASYAAGFPEVVIPYEGVVNFLDK